MPEGHTIHRAARDQNARLSGRRITSSSPQGRFAAASIDGLRLVRVEPHGKHLFYVFDGPIVHVHLALFGKFLDVSPDPPAPRPQVRWRAMTDAGGFDLVAPRTCEVIDAERRRALIARLGPDPLRGDPLGPATERILSSSKPVGALLMDQAIVAGIGNVFRAEALYASRIHPGTPGRELTGADVERIWKSVKPMMRRAVRDGRIAPRRIRGSSAATMPEAETRYVYKRDRCAGCGASVERYELAGRTAYFCPREQSTTARRARTDANPAANS